MILLSARDHKTCICVCSEDSIYLVNGVLGTVENPAMATDKPNRVGLVISTTPLIRVFLSAASKDSSLSDELQQASSDLLLQSEVPYAPLRAVWMASDPSTRPDLTRLFSGTRFIFSSPKPREKVSFLFLLSVSISQFLIPFNYDYLLFRWLQNLLVDSILCLTLLLV